MTFSTALPFHVGHVLGVGAEEEMVRPAAWGIVAPVADIHARRDRAVGLLPGETMGKHRGCSVPEGAVAVDRSAPHPRPAAIRVSTVDPRRERVGKAGRWMAIASSGAVLRLASVHLGRDCGEGAPAAQADARDSLALLGVTAGCRAEDSSAPGELIRTRLEGGAACAAGTLNVHQAYSWCQTPGVDARRGHFVLRFYHIVRGW
jgi:hypothetical protein